MAFSFKDVFLFLVAFETLFLSFTVHKKQSRLRLQALTGLALLAFVVPVAFSGIYAQFAKQKVLISNTAKIVTATTTPNPIVITTTAPTTTQAPVATSPVATSPVAIAPKTTLPPVTAPTTTQAPVATSPVAIAPKTTLPPVTAPTTTQAPVATSPVVTAPTTTQAPAATVSINAYSSPTISNNQLVVKINVNLTNNKAPYPGQSVALSDNASDCVLSQASASTTDASGNWSEVATCSLTGSPITFSVSSDGASATFSQAR